MHCRQLMQGKIYLLLQVPVLWYVNPEEKSLADNDWLIFVMDQLKHATCQVEDGFKLVNHFGESALTIHLPQQIIILCPEMVYVVDDSKIKGILYGKTKVNIKVREAICYSGKAPSGFHVCRYTYEHTVSDGSPDLRYKNNPRYPIVEFTKIEMVIDDVSYFFIASNAEFVKAL